MLSKKFFNVGDKLTANDFNAIVSLYRKSVKHSEKIRISNEAYVGEYGVFEFNFNGATILDNGVVVSDETISAIPRVRLTDTFFKTSKYILQLDILHFTGINILDDIAPENFKVVDVLEVELIPNTWVEIPLDNIEEGYIISFNANVLIDHNTPVLQGSWLNELILSSDGDMVQVGDNFILTVFAKDMGDVGIVDEPITFYQKYSNLDVKIFPVGTEKFFDNAILEHYTSSYHNVSKKLKVTVENDGTLLEANTGYNGYYFANLEGSPTGSLPKVRDFKLPCIVEVDLVEVDETIIDTEFYYGFGFNDGVTHRIPFKDISPTGRHFKIVLDGVNAICYSDDLWEPIIIPFELNGNVGVSLMVANGSYLKFKNFKINETYNTVTDDTGNAICEVSGDGSGVDEFYAKARNIESGKLDIIDGVLLDKATLLSYNDLFNNMESFTRMEDGTSVYYHNTGSSTYQLAFPNYMYFNGKEYAIDIELLENNYARLQVARYKTGSINQYDAKVITGNGKIHIELLNDGIFWYQNDELIQSSTTKTNDERFSFFILTPTNTTSDFKYKNLIVYPVKIDEKLILSVDN